MFDVSALLLDDALLKCAQKHFLILTKSLFQAVGYMFNFISSNDSSTLKMATHKITAFYVNDVNGATAPHILTGVMALRMAIYFAKCRSRADQWTSDGQPRQNRSECIITDYIWLTENAGLETKQCTGVVIQGSTTDETSTQTIEVDYEDLVKLQNYDEVGPKHPKHWWDGGMGMGLYGASLLPPQQFRYRLTSINAQSSSN